MRYLIIFGLIWVLSLSSVIAQGNKTPITGKVIDKSGEPLPYASVAVHRPSDSSVVTGSSTNDEGSFSVKVPPGTYYVRISFLSYQSKIIPEVQVANEPVQLGTQTLEHSSKSLDEVVVEEEHSKVELKLDKKVFNVGQDLSTQGGNASDILENVPSVTVDMEGNVSLRGSGNVRILINGKPSGMVSADDPQSLRQLQGNMIEKVEVITNPSSKYSAEGEVGIINIVLKEQDKSGLHGSFDANTGYPHDHGFAANLNYRKNWFNIFLSEGISWEKDPGGGESVQEFTYPDTSYSYHTLRDQTRGDFSNNFRLGADFYLTPKDVITLSGLYQYSTGNNLSTTTYEDFDEEEQHIRTIKRYQDEKEVSHEVEFDLSYEKKFKQKDHKLTLDAKYNLEDDREVARYEQNDLSIDSSINQIERSDNLEYEKTWLFQADYVYPFGNEGKVSTGLKANLRNFINDYRVEQKTGPSDWEDLPRYTNEFIYKEHIYAAYVSAKEKWGAFSAKAGLRTEYSDIRTELVKTNETNPRDYIDFFPSVFLGYKIGEKNKLQASYSRRISRPGFWDLVPFMQYADSRNYYSGNPDLNPEYTHSFEAGYQRYLKQGNFVATLYYRHRAGVFERITYIEPSGLTRIHPVNLATENDYGVELSGNYNITDWWRFTGSFNAFRAITEGSYQGVSLYSDTYAWNSQLSTKISPTDRLDFQSSLRYRGPRTTTQGRRKASYAIDFGASMKFFDKRGTLTLSVRDILDTRKRRWVKTGEHFRTEGEFQWHTARQVLLSFNYRLDQQSTDKKSQRGEYH